MKQQDRTVFSFGWCAAFTGFHCERRLIGRRLELNVAHETQSMKHKAFSCREGASFLERNLRWSSKAELLSLWFGVWFFTGSFYKQCLIEETPELSIVYNAQGTTRNLLRCRFSIMEKVFVYSETTSTTPVFLFPFFLSRLPLRRSFRVLEAFVTGVRARAVRTFPFFFSFLQGDPACSSPYL
ncbi:MAG: hypothetical protein LBR88_03125 [Zoogloeaceae bacterium]|jgi:hypothetical protein|nr:hypothetical protein [Zoogloeaceae bacterium]